MFLICFDGCPHVFTSRWSVRPLRLVLTDRFAAKNSNTSFNRMGQKHRDMKTYKVINNIMGWLMFVEAAFTYCSTVEPTASFWDCPEFICAASRLEVGHSPGAPFFMLVGNVFRQFASYLQGKCKVCANPKIKCQVIAKSNSW